LIDNRLHLAGKAGSRIVGMNLPETLVSELRAALGEEHVFTDPAQLRVYDCDGLTGWRALPALVALPGTTEEVQAVVRRCHRDRVPFVARGAGTGLSGGALPVAEGIVISLARMSRILEIDLPSQRVVVEPGVTNLEVTRAVEDEGWFYAPDPSSQQVCTIGGNVAENSGGAHCLKNGFTVTHVTGLTVVLPDGELVELGGKALDPDGPDLLGVFVGSEGTLGIATRIVLRVVRRPEAVITQLAAFRSLEAAGEAVSAIVGAGIVPAAVELMDRLTLEAVEQALRPGYPEGAAAILLVELDGVAVQVAEDARAVEAICRGCGAFELRAARDEGERALLWLGRKAAFPAMGRVSPDYYVQDGVVPRTKLPEVLRRIGELEREYGLRVGNVFHAGDGNLHPLVLYDARKGETERAKELAEAILSACLDAGGSLTGEHGVGVDKACAMPEMFSERDLEAFARLRRAFDPDGLANPGKLLPTPRLCGEVPGPYRLHPLERIGVAQRF
jgi:glycolate oxidase